MTYTRLLLLLAAPIALGLHTACDRPEADTTEAEKQAGGAAKLTAPVTVYTSVDEEFARMVLGRFEEQTGINLNIVTDSEAGKTTGLVRRMQAESDQPRADVFWSSELFNTIVLARAGLLAPYDPATAADIPARYRDMHHRWTAFGLRGRVIGFNPDTTDRDTLPMTWRSLSEKQHAGRLAFANPLFGTTRGHVAAMVALWGKEATRQFLTNLRDRGAMMVDGNSTALRKVVAGEAAMCATDTDDVWVAQRGGMHVDLIYPDMGDGGTLLIPCSIALLKNGPNPAGGQKLVDFLASAEVEKLLAQSTSRNIPVRAALRKQLDMNLPPQTKVPYDDIADAMSTGVELVREILIR